MIASNITVIFTSKCMSLTIFSVWWTENIHWIQSYCCFCFVFFIEFPLAQCLFFFFGVLNELSAERIHFILKYTIHFIFMLIMNTRKYSKTHLFGFTTIYCIYSIFILVFAILFFIMCPTERINWKCLVFVHFFYSFIRLKFSDIYL